MSGQESERGGWGAFLAYLVWGLFPLYFNRLETVPAVEVLAHRIVWGAVFGIAVILILGRRRSIVAVCLDRRLMIGLLGSALCITVNWGFFIWAVGNGHALDASIGYFINPLVNVLLGALFLKERLTGRQTVALLLVGAGVATLAGANGGVPWIALVLPVTFGLYGLIRKLVPVDALAGFSVETLLTAPFAALFLFTRPEGGALLAAAEPIPAFLILAGPVTAIPLMLFAFGARRLKLSTLGLLQYFSPTIQMAIAVLVFHEPFTTVHAVTFAFIWAGLALYSSGLAFPGTPRRPAGPSRCPR